MQFNIGPAQLACLRAPQLTDSFSSGEINLAFWLYTIMYWAIALTPRLGLKFELLVRSKKKVLN